MCPPLSLSGRGQGLSTAQLEIAPPIQTAAIGRSHDPHLSTTPGGVESRRCSAQLEKDFLGHMLGFGRIVQNTKRDAVDQPREAVQENEVWAVMDHTSNLVNIEAGVGMGLTAGSDRLTLKLMLSRDLNPRHKSAP
jgi:hypothetical protein